jgi:hypothetical protein
MSQAYGILPRSLLIDPRVVGLTSNGFRLVVHALCGPHTNLIGAFHWPDGYISEDMRWSSETVSETVSEVLATGLLKRFGGGRYMLVPEFFEFNTLQNPNPLTAALKQLAALPPDPEIQIVINNLEPFVNRFGKEFPKRLETIRQRLMEGFANTLSLSLPLPLPKTNGVEGNGAPLAETEFDRFFAAYPKKVGERPAREEFDAALKKASADVIIDGAKRYAASVAGSEKKFIKEPANWLREERWQDGQPLPAAVLTVPPGWGEYAEAAIAIGADIGVDRFTAYFGNSEIDAGPPKIIRVSKKWIADHIPRCADVHRAITKHLGKDTEVVYAAPKVAA